MSGLLLELRRQIAHNRRKAAYEERMRASAQENRRRFFAEDKRDKAGHGNTARSTGKES